MLLLIGCVVKPVVPRLTQWYTKTIYDGEAAVGESDEWKRTRANAGRGEFWPGKKERELAGRCGNVGKHLVGLNRVLKRDLKHVAEIIERIVKATLKEFAE